jgi:hypothetical protein
LAIGFVAEYGFDLFNTALYRKELEMKKQVALVAALFIGLVGLNSPAFADEAWFVHHDHNHDGHWDYAEFRKAHYEWYKTHPNEKKWKDAELRQEFDRMSASHHGWVAPEDVRTWHTW